MTATAETYLGPATEALLAEYFADSVTITAQRAAKLLGLDEKVLRAMTDEGVIRAVRRGERRGYAERDVRAYLLEGTAEPCRQEEKERAKSTPGRGKVVRLSEIMASKPQR